MERTQTPFYEPYRSIDKFTLSDLEIVRLILRGRSVLDWHKLNLTKANAETFIRTHRLLLDNQDHIALVERIKAESVLYLRETLSFPVPKPIRNASFIELTAMATDDTSRHRQLCACTLLKTMHIVNHFDANEARQALAMTDQELFKTAERRIYRLVSQMMAEGLPVVEFLGGRKQRASMVTKLLSKNSPLSTQLFDKMRFRIITTSLDDVLPVISFLARNVFPFNYVLAGESHNTLLPFAAYCSKNPHLSQLLGRLQMNPEIDNTLNPMTNLHSSPDYKVIHWVVDMPLRIENFQTAFRTDGVNPIPRPIVYVRTELQILDRRSHRQNERGEASHNKYKNRQLKSVATRLKVGIRKQKIANGTD